MTIKQRKELTESLMQCLRERMTQPKSNNNCRIIALIAYTLGELDNHKKINEQEES